MKTCVGLTYTAAGVDIDAGGELVRRIEPAAESTARPGVVDGLGGFAGLFDLKAAGYSDPVLVAATDGVGTKLRVAIDTGRVDTIGIDLVAMCVNDLVCRGAEPLFFLDYFAAGTLDVGTAERVVNGIAAGCRASGCALIGGETAEMPGMYDGADFDLAGFAVGAVERGKALPAGMGAGDVLLGLHSDGLHSNGYALARIAVRHAGLSWNDAAPFADTSLGEALLTPTRIYARAAIASIKSGGVHGIAHITGGGLVENIPRLLPKGLAAKIDLGSWSLPPVFRWLRKTGGLTEAELLRTFNAGIGMVMAVAPEFRDGVMAELETAGQRAQCIGVVEPGQCLRFSGSLS